jgi:hypothetical protein
VPWIAAVHRTGQGYASTSWTDNALIVRVRTLTPAAHLFSNGNDAIYLLTGRLADRLPERESPLTGLHNVSFESEVEWLRSEVA